MKLFTISLALLLLTSCSYFSPISRERKVFKPSWIKNLDTDYQTGNLPIGLGSPLVTSDTVYVGDNNGFLKAFSVDNGRLLWKEPTLGAMNSSPIMVGSLLIYGDAHGRVYAKDIETGKFKYQFDLGASLDSTPVHAKGRLIIHTRNHKVFTIDAQTGKILWTYKRSVPFFSTLQRTARPLVVANRVFVGFADGYLLSFSIEEGQVLWEKRIATASKFVDVDMMATYFQGKLVVGAHGASVQVIDAQKGILYKKLPFSSNREAFVSEGKVYFGTSDGRIVTLDDSFNVDKDVKIGDFTISSISKWKDGLIITTIGNKVKYLNNSFKVEETFDLGTNFSGVFGSVGATKDALAIYSSRNRLYLFR